jgi:signal transduction histidine kinase
MFKEYASLHEGTYHFHVRARDSQGRVSDEQIFSFRILPPWHRTWWARTLFVLAAMTVGGTLAWMRVRFLSKLNRQLEARVAHDTRELLALNDRLRRLNEKKTQFLSIAAHDLNNPLNAILLRAELMEVGTDSAKIARGAQIIQDEGLRMRNILRRFLNVTAIEEGSFQPPNTSPLNWPSNRPHRIQWSAPIAISAKRPWPTCSRTH